MSELIRFPPSTATATQVAESDQIITLFSGATLHKGGEAAYTDISAWKKAQNGKASTYTGVVLEFLSTEEAPTVGNGTLAQAIGLFGEISGSGGGKFLLGLVGINLGGTVPQVPLVRNAAAENIGMAQLTADISAYDKLSIGGVFNDVAVPAAATLTVKVRPVSEREYLG